MCLLKGSVFFEKLLTIISENLFTVKPLHLLCLQIKTLTYKAYQQSKYLKLSQEKNIYY